MATRDTRGSDGGARALVLALDAVRARGETQRWKLHSYELAPARIARILDVGCGTGDDVLALAERCGPATEVVGVDRRPALLAEAKRRARNVALNVHFIEGDARALPFADRAFDLVRADRLLDEVEDEARVIAELVRVVRPRGRVVVLDRDRLAPASVERRADARGARGLADLLFRGGLVEVKIEQRWTWTDGAVESAAREGLTVVGTRPGSDEGGD